MVEKRVKYIEILKLFGMHFIYVGNYENAAEFLHKFVFVKGLQSIKSVGVI